MTSEATKKTILIIDDEPDVIFVLEIALKKLNHKTITAKNGQEGLEKIQQSHPDVIIMDVMMPKLDGHSVVLKLKENSATQNIPVILMTGKGDLKEFLNIRENIDVAAYFEKPFKINQLIDRVKEILNT